MKFEKFAEVFRYTLKIIYKEEQLRERTGITFEQFVKREYQKHQRTKTLTWWNE